MNIQKTIIASIDDVRTGVVNDPSEFDHLRMNSHAFTVDPDGGGAEILVRHRDHGFRVWMTRTQAGQFADDLRGCLEETLPRLASIRQEAVREGNETMSRLLAVVELTPVRALDDLVYDAEGEVADFYRFSAWCGTVTLILGDNLTWGCERRMTEMEAHELLDAINGNIAA